MYTVRPFSRTPVQRVCWFIRLSACNEIKTIALRANNVQINRLSDETRPGPRRRSRRVPFPPPRWKRHFIRRTRRRSESMSSSPRLEPRAGRVGIFFKFFPPSAALDRCAIWFFAPRDLTPLAAVSTTMNSVLYH